MNNKFIAIINPETHSAEKIRKFFNKKNVKTVALKDKEGLTGILKENISKGFYEYILCGGDGTINNFLNCYSGLPTKLKEKINVGIIPCGKANDLANYLKIPGDIEKAFSIISKKRIKKIDLIEVNNKCFATGGGLGLPAEVILETKTYSKIGRKFRSKVLKDITYVIAVLKKFIWKYKGIKNIVLNNTKINNELMLIAVQNQPFIGKRFNLAPDASNTDGKFEVIIIKKPKSLISNLLVLSDIIKGEHINKRWARKIKSSSVEIKTMNKEFFMGDGEILCNADNFKIKIIKDALNVFC